MAAQSKPKFDTEKFRASIADASRWHGKFLDLPDDTHRTHAAAMVINSMMNLRNHAEHKALTRDDIQQAIDAFMTAADIDTRTGPMGREEFFSKGNRAGRTPLLKFFLVVGPGAWHRGENLEQCIANVRASVGATGKTAPLQVWASDRRFDFVLEDGRPRITRDKHDCDVMVRYEVGFGE